MQKFTQEQLMLYLYGEASPILSLAINKALKEDKELQKEIMMLQRSKKQLNELKKMHQNPSDKTIERIMNYAKENSGKKKK
jgi:anti-sigma factor RsiW